MLVCVLRSGWERGNWGSLVDIVWSQLGDFLGRLERWEAGSGGNLQYNTIQ